jgi:hypothetical protein
MKTRTEDPLLTAIFADGLPAEFSAGLLAETLREVRRQKRRVAAARGFMAVALATVMLGAMQNRIPRAAEESVPPSSHSVVRSRPLAAGMIVTSTFLSVDIAETKWDTVARVESAPADHLFEWLDDVELFAFAGDRPAGWVRLENQTARFVWPGAARVVLR